MSNLNGLPNYHKEIHNMIITSKKQFHSSEITVQPYIFSSGKIIFGRKKKKKKTLFPLLQWANGRLCFKFYHCAEAEAVMDILDIKPKHKKIHK